MKKLNWPLWLGFIITIFSFFSYPIIFVNWATTRDFPWANLVLFVIAFVLLFFGVRRAFAPGRRVISRVIASVLATLSVLALGMFIFVAFVASRWLPPSTNAPQVGQKAPDFALMDTNNKSVSLSALLTQPIEPVRPAMVAESQPSPRGVLLIFYRGYW